MERRAMMSGKRIGISSSAGSPHAAHIFCMICLLMVGTGCSSSRLYKGQVVFGDTGLPVAGEEVRGGWMYTRGLQLTLDGFFDRGSEQRCTETDEEGRWELRLEGYSRRLLISRGGYKTVRFSLEGWPRDKEVLIKLEPNEESK
jgi:hypothetical protein